MLGLGIQGDLIEESVVSMKQKAWERLIKTIKDEVSDLAIQEKLRKRLIKLT